MRFENLTVAILAGGEGSRLQPLLGKCPKVLAEVKGKPFLSYLLDRLSLAGITQVVLCTGYLGHRVKDAFGKKYKSVRIRYSEEKSALDTGGALRLALRFFTQDSVLVMNGDSFCDINLKSFWEWHCKRDALVSMVLTKATDTARYGRVEVTSSGLIKGFHEKKRKAGAGWVNAGIYLIKRGLLTKIPGNKPLSLEKEIFPALIGEAFFGYKSKNRFLDIGTPRGYKEARQFFSIRIIPKVIGQALGDKESKRLVEEREKAEQQKKLEDETKRARAVLEGLKKSEKRK